MYRRDLPFSRRDVLRAAAVGATAWAMPAAFGDDSSQTSPDLSTAWADVVSVGKRTWAILAKAGDMRVVSNGGIVAGRDSVLVIEGHNSIDGGAWVSEVCEKLTGKRPTHVVVTHLHGDHTRGLAGLARAGAMPQFIATQTTRDMLLERQMSKNDQSTLSSSGFVRVGDPQLIPDVMLRGQKTYELDLGGRSVRFTERFGHTASDLTVELDDVGVTWAGDLVFNMMFPYYGDANPPLLKKTCEALIYGSSVRFVPGHGAIARSGDLDSYFALLDEIERAARAGLGAGRSAKEIASDYALPSQFSEWFIWSPRVFAHAFEAWERALKDTPRPD